MNNKRIVVASCVVVLSASALAVNRNAVGKHPHPVLPSTQETSAGESNVPDHVVYSFLFRNVVSLKAKIKELQAQGKIERRKPAFPLQKEAKLDDARARALETIASDCLQAIARQDDKAKIIMDRYRAQFPDNKIPEGVTPPPPPELKIMWEERNAIVLRARDQLCAAFGEQEFRRFDQQVKFPHGADDESVKRRRTNITPVAPSP